MEKQEIVELLNNDFDSDISDNETIVSDHECESEIECGSDFHPEQLTVASKQSSDSVDSEEESDTRFRYENIRYK
ncbi:hypothetical protein PR048_015256 [Dryococelus australis]|uniref:Uncharacterized protein n=1 Tax=Dryococelus australis TaxID=614101 RepID=A0ABQ9HGG1_9NEOP|nr:hypothetical protein PR048_015256 [Dryococelus australis]